MKSHVKDFLEQSYSRRSVFTGVGKIGIAFSGIAAMGATGRHWGVPGRWATGGTGVMHGFYPDPFLCDTGSVCELTCAQMLGPCFTPTLVRSDISEGRSGIPMRLSLRILNERCEPVEGASVDVWHVAPEGIYSGQVLAMCNEKDEDAKKAAFFRGVQITDARGRVDFDSCFPGWYTRRAVHIHFTVRVGNVEYLTSQLYFEDTIADDIIANYAGYSERGPRDTTNTQDKTINKEEVPKFIVGTKRMRDGAMQAWKTIMIRSSLETALCQTPGEIFPPGGGTPPSDGSLPPPN